MSSRAIIIGLAVAAVLAALAAYTLHVRHLGWQDGFAACQAEQERREQANRDAITEAERELLRKADALSLRHMELDNALAGNDQAAAADPDGGHLCLGPGSVQRLNTIR